MKSALAIPMFLGARAEVLEESMLQTKSGKKASNTLSGIGADDYETEGAEEFQWSMAAITKKEYGGSTEDNRNMLIQDIQDKTTLDLDQVTKQNTQKTVAEAEKTFNEKSTATVTP